MKTTNTIGSDMNIFWTGGLSEIRFTFSREHFTCDHDCIFSISPFSLLIIYKTKSTLWKLHKICNTTNSNQIYKKKKTIFFLS